MRQNQSVRIGKYRMVYLLAVLLAVMTMGCSDGTKGVIDPNAVEHNPNQQMSPIPVDEQGNSGTDGSLLPETVPQDPVGSNGNAGTNESTDKADAETNPENPGNTENPDNAVTAEPVEPVQPEYVVVLDPGHGGRFTGAVHGLVEKETVLKIALYAKAYLEEHYPQIEVKMTRDSDQDFDEQLAKDLENRVQLGKEMGADAFVSFHLNASVAHNIRGAEVICPHRENVKTDSFLLANCILDELTALGIKRRGIVTKNSNDTVDANGNPVEYYAINRHAANRNMVGIIVEHCFMDNEEDKFFLTDEAALQRLGEADARGIAAYFGY